MAHTKRKRRTKHRGNAVGVVEARGRTSKPREGQAKGGGSSGRGRTAARALKPPTLKGAALKALIGASLLFIFFTLTESGRSPVSALVFCVFAMALYTPVMFMTDKWVYNRKLKQLGGGGASGGKARR